MAKNYRDEKHLNSKQWLLYKESVPELSRKQFEIAVGMVLGDASIQKRGKHAHIKFEQGKKQKEFLEHLFDVFKNYCFMMQPGERHYIMEKGLFSDISKQSEKQKNNQETIKSFWFRTFSHKSFTEVWKLFYFAEDISQLKLENDSQNAVAVVSQKQESFLTACKALKEKQCILKSERNKKSISFDLVNNFITPISFAYWVMCDGSLDRSKKSLTLHTQGFSFRENVILSDALNERFNIKSCVIVHKKKYYVIRISRESAPVVNEILKNYLIPSMMYKLPQE